MTGSGATPSGQDDERGQAHASRGPCVLPDYHLGRCWVGSHPTTPPAPAQEAGSGRHVQSAARNLTITPGMSSELDGGRQAAVEAVARELSSNVAFFWGVSVGIDRAKLPEFWTEVATVAVAALSQPGEPT